MLIVDNVVVREITNETKIWFLINEERTQYLVLILHYGRFYEYITIENTSFGFEIFEVIGKLLSLFDYEEKSELIDVFISSFTKENNMYDFLLQSHDA
jgi:hypothetical protein